MAKSYLQYRFKAKGRHGIHSPFVYALIEEVIRRKGCEREAELNALRAAMRSNSQRIEIVDLGAGSRRNGRDSRKISQVARISAATEKDTAFLQRLATYCKSENVLELGANLGLTTAALAAAPNTKKLVSIEGSDALAALAVKNLKKLHLQATIINGSFEDKLALALNELLRPDFVYIDGNHKKKPTLCYVEQVLKFKHDSLVVVIGDIHWSAGMEEAWEIIRLDKRISISLDLFKMGILFFRNDVPKQHFILRY